MAKSIAILFGVIYVALGVLGFVANPLIGSIGFFASNTAYSVVFIVVGLIMLAVAIWATRAQTHGWNMAIGVVLILVAIAGFVTTPDGGNMFGFTVSMSDHWLNVIAGIIILVSGLAHREAHVRTMRTATL